MNLPLTLVTLMILAPTTPMKLDEEDSEVNDLWRKGIEHGPKYCKKSKKKYKLS
jgi:hypothetical protein